MERGLVLAAVFAVVSAGGSFYSFYQGASGIDARLQAIRTEKADDDYHRGILDTFGKQFASTSAHSQRLILLGLMRLRDNRRLTPKEAQSMQDGLSRLEGLKVQVDQYSAALDRYISHQGMRARRSTSGNWNLLLGPFVSLIAGILGFAQFADYLDTVRPQHHFRYSLDRERDRDPRWQQASRSLRFIQYSILVLTSFGTSEVQPASPLARATSCVVSIVGIIYILGIIAAGVSMFVS